MAEPRIRPGRPSDAEALEALYGHYVRATPTTFDVEPWGVERRRAWLGGFAETGRHRLFVVEEGEELLGYACSRPFRDKAAYDPSVETSVYLRPHATGRGLGARLYQQLFEALEGADVHRALAGITLPNAASVALHERFGFRRVGVFHEVGRKLGRYWDVLWMEKPLGSDESSPKARTQ